MATAAGVLAVLHMALIILFSEQASSLAAIPCSRSYLGRLGTGHITSPNYPFDYGDNLTCRYTIYVGSGLTADQPGVTVGSASGASTAAVTSLTVCLTFMRFGLESSSPFCSFDYVELQGTGADSPSRIKYCGAGLWQYGVEEKGNPLSNIWSQNLCWVVRAGSTFEMKFSSDNTINGTGFYAVYTVTPTSSNNSSTITTTTTTTLSSSGQTSGKAPCGPTQWVCFNRRCIERAQLCNNVDDCGDGSDESYLHARCPGKQKIFACDFSDGASQDGYCELLHEGWSRTSSSQLPFGPSGDHTNGSAGFYLSTESRVTPSYLVSPVLNLPLNRSYCLSFHYFISASPYIPTASIRVFVTPEQDRIRPVWSRTDQPGTGGVWKRAEVEFVLSSALQVTFLVLLANATGVAGNEKLSLDDISMLDGTCSGADVSCNFETTSFCGWSSAKRLVSSAGPRLANLEWTSENRLTSSLGLAGDHSSSDGSGSYAVISSRSSGNSFLVSPGISAANAEHRCLQFWFAASSASNLITVRLYGYDDSLSVLSNQTANTPGTWTLAAVEMDVSGSFQIVIEAVLKADGSAASYIAIDELLLSDGVCIARGGCTTGQYRCAVDSTCISSALLCDGRQQCSDGSDEDWRAGCASTLPSIAASTVVTADSICPVSSNFRCVNASICIPQNWLCDSVNDCGDYSDEGPLAGCTDANPESTLPAMSSKTTKTTTSTTTRATTTTSRTAIVCSSTEFTCASDGSCLPLFVKCDGVADCIDQSDELSCATVACTSTPVVVTCEPGLIFCRSESRCIPNTSSCGVTLDCGDGTDDPHCTGRPHGLNAGAIGGIVVGCCLSLIVLLIVAVVVVMCRRRQKSGNRSQPHCTSSRSTTSVSTISAGNGTTVPFNGSALQRASLQRNRDNAGYTHRDSWATSPQQEEPPPPYSSLARGAAATASDRSRDGLQRDRRTGRSLPPTPTRPPPPSAVAMSSHPGDSSFSEHIYDEPTTLFRDCPPPAPAVVPTTLGTLTSYPRSSTSRIRLGTTALRPGSARCHSPLSPGSSYGHHNTGIRSIRGTPVSSTNSPHVGEGIRPTISPFDGPPPSLHGPFYISNFPVSPATISSSASPSDISDLERNIPYPTGAFSDRLSPFGVPYPAPPSANHQPQSAEMLANGDVYDQPWESIVDRVPGSIPLTAIPGHMTMQNGALYHSQNGPRRVPESLSLLNGRTDFDPRQQWSDRRGMGRPSQSIQPQFGTSRPHDRLLSNRQDGTRYGAAGGTLDRHYRPHQWRSNHQDIMFDGGNNPQDQPQFHNGVGVDPGMNERRDGPAARNHFHPRSDSAESCGNSSSSPLVADSRQYRSNNDVLNYLSPTSV